MQFDARVVEAQIALNLISTTDMPRLAWDALEAGLDGPAIRRLAALDSPTFFEVRAVLPHAMKEMGLAEMKETDAAVRLARVRAREILHSETDPLKHLRDFEYLWISADYCKELAECGCLDDEVYVARCAGQSDAEISVWVKERIQRLASD